MKPTVASKDALGQAMEQRDWFAERITPNIRGGADQLEAYMRDVFERFGLEQDDAETVLSALATIYWMVDAGMPFEAASGALLVYCSDIVKAREEGPTNG